MADTLKFRCIDGGVPDASALQSDEPALLFKMTAEGQMDLQMGRLSTKPSKTSRPVIRDWRNQELADLFRVKRLLDAAGVACEIDRGVTDEGDPWFVFCRGDGEVFAHFCRIDELYILDSPTIDRPLRGRDFNALINDFTGLSQTTAGSTLNQNDDTAHRVVRLTRSSTLRLHPSAILAALIWTFLLSSEELVLIRPADEGDDHGNDPLEGLVPSDEDIATWSDEDIETIGEAEMLMAMAARNQDPKMLEKSDLPYTEDKTAQASQAVSTAPNATAMTLSALAINMGFLSEALLSEKYAQIFEDLETPAALASALRNQEIHPGDRQATAVHTGSMEDAPAFTGSGYKLDATALKGAMVDKRLPDDAAAVSEGSFKLSIEQVAPVTFFSDTMDRSGPVAFEKDLKTRGEVQDAPSSNSSSGQDAFSMDPSSLIDLAQLTSFQDIKQAVQDLWLPALHEYTFDTVTLHSSFDMTRYTGAVDGVLDLVAEDTPADTADEVVSTPQTSSVIMTPVTPGAPQMYDDEARKYIDYVISSGEIEFVYTQDHVVLIDVDVLSNPMARQFSQTWNFSDGGSISLIGLQSDYMDYLMHA
jgi:hypothetical protein